MSRSTAHNRRGPKTEAVNELIHCLCDEGSRTQRASLDSGPLSAGVKDGLAWTELRGGQSCPGRG